MVLRIFLVLLLVNTIAFVARADAAEQDETAVPSPVELLDPLDQDEEDQLEDDILDLAGAGAARLLRWRFSERAGDEQRYASERVYADHGVTMAEDGAALNLLWRF